jgi:RNA polymerase sigma-70 factor (ECF subfamily)
MVPEISEAELINRFRTGSKKEKEDSFTELMRRHHRLMYGCAYHMISDTHAVQDIVNISMAKVYEHLGSLEDLGRFSPWLRQTVDNTARDWLRKNKRNIQSLDALKNTEGDALDVEAPDTSPADDLALQDEMRGFVRNEIAKLPESQREIVVLKYLGQKTYEEIMALTGLSQATIESRLHRAREKLKGPLERFLKRENNGTRE